MIRLLDLKLTQQQLEITIQVVLMFQSRFVYVLEVGFCATIISMEDKAISPNKIGN